MRNKQEEKKFLIFYAPDPANLGQMIVVGKHPLHENHLDENKCLYCRTVFFERSNCPNCGAPGKNYG